jgi:hypothetical protein
MEAEKVHSLRFRAGIIPVFPAFKRNITAFSKNEAHT